MPTIKNDSPPTFRDRVENLLTIQKSKLLSITPGSTNQRSIIGFVCVKCGEKCTKQWEALQRLGDNRISAYCKKCARKVAGESHKKTNIKKQKNREKISKSVENDPTKRYCEACREIHPIEYYINFQTGNPTKTCKIVRQRKQKSKQKTQQKTNGNIKRKVTTKELEELLNKDKATLIKIDYMNKVNRLTMKTWVDIKCGECDKIDKKRVDAIIRTGGFCKVCANNKASIKKSNSAQGVKRGPIKNRNEESYIKRRAYSIDDVKKLLEENGTVLIGEGYDKRLSTKQKIKFICASEKCSVVREKSIRDIIRGGCYCEVCTQKNKSAKISKMKTHTDSTK